jgi:hypothetical protein
MNKTNKDSLEKGLHKFLDSKNSSKNLSKLSRQESGIMIKDNSKDELLKQEKIKIYKEICQCYSQCLKFKDSEYKLNQEASVCNKISIDSLNTSEDLRKLINKSMAFLIKNNYIKAIGSKENHKYYITLNNATVKFNWENIKTLKDKNKPEVELFWLVRKLIVDSLLKIIINEHNKVPTSVITPDGEILINPNDFNDVKIYSVGSTDITSDYDITLYSSNNYVIRIIIEDFQNRFMKIFGEHSSIVFDTNIYGKAYIIFDCEQTCEINYIPIDLSRCLTQKESFYYIKSLNDNTGLIRDGIKGEYRYNQVIWGLIKYLRDLRDNFGENIYNKYFNFIKKNVTNSEILDITQESLIYLRNTNTSYTDLIENEELHKRDYKNNNYNSLLFTNDYISLINFYGEETYFTRGAFLDTVVNAQMCKSDSSIPLYKEDYIASILENAGFFFLHNDKTKYLKRVKNSLILLTENNKEYEYILKSIYFHDLSNVTSDGYDYCNWIDSDDFNLLKCEKYDMFQVVFKLIYRLLSTYLNTINFKNFPFHSLYVKDQLVELRSPKDIDFIPEFISNSVTSSRRSSFDTSAYEERTLLAPRSSINTKNLSVLPNINLPPIYSENIEHSKEPQVKPRVRSRGQTIVARPQTLYTLENNDNKLKNKTNSLSNLSKFDMLSLS